MIHHQSQMWPASLEPNKEVGIEWFFRETLWHEITKGSINKTKIIYVYHTHVRLTRAASFSRSQTRQMSLTLCQDHLLRVQGGSSVIVVPYSNVPGLLALHTSLDVHIGITISKSVHPLQGSECSVVEKFTEKALSNQPHESVLYCADWACVNLTQARWGTSIKSDCKPFS